MVYTRMISVVPAYRIPLTPHMVTMKFIPTGCRIGMVQLVALAGISWTQSCSLAYRS